MEKVDEKMLEVRACFGGFILRHSFLWTDMCNFNVIAKAFSGVIGTLVRFWFRNNVKGACVISLAITGNRYVASKSMVAANGVENIEIEVSSLLRVMMASSCKFEHLF